MGTGLSPGLTYRIRVEVRNSIGYSLYSNEVSALTAIVPTAPLSPSTLLDVNNVVVKWSAPSFQSATAFGSAIQGYKVFIRWQDGTYGTQLTHCDGSDPTIVAETECIVPISVLMASPFNLQIGQSVFVSVVCYNEVGDSPNSAVGNGAIIQISTVPDAPVSVVRDLSEPLSMTKISIAWSDGAHNGNQPVLDYRIMQ